ncbi:MAG: T9SS type A sorting domain-containing protein, partial [Bacteroidota bacterium]
TEEGTEMVITGDGTGGAYAAFAYTLHDASTGDAVTVDMTVNDKLYIKAKSTVDGVPFRIDLKDADGFVTTEPSVVRQVGTEYSVIEYDFANTYSDGGYGGTACDMGPCPVDGQNIIEFLLYLDPDNGGYNGTFTIDWISTIKPLEEDPGPSLPEGIDAYDDQFEDGKNDFVSDEAGLVSSEANGEFVITGDGTSGAYAPVAYDLHLADTAVIVNAEKNDFKLFIRAKCTKADMPLRVDMRDSRGYITSSPGVQVTVPADFAILELDYSGKMSDGGFGGTPCTSGPCPVDGKRIGGLDFYLDPGVGMFDGELVIDWVSFGKPLSVNVLDPEKVETVKLFPNPMQSELYLQISSVVSGDLSVAVFDISGRQIRQLDLGRISTGSSQETLPLGDLEQGLYLIDVRIDGQPVALTKLVKR